MIWCSGVCSFVAFILGSKQPVDNIMTWWVTQCVWYYMNNCNGIEHITVCLDIGGQVGLSSSLFNFLFHYYHIATYLFFCGFSCLFKTA